MTKRKFHLLLPLIIAAITPLTAKAAPENEPALTPAPQTEPATKITVSVIGVVAHPGTFQLSGEANFLSALRAAGGLETVDFQVDLANIKVIRAGVKLNVNMKTMFKGDYAQNIRIEDGDIIVVSRIPAGLLPPRTPTPLQITPPKVAPLIVKPSTSLDATSDLLKRLDDLRFNSEKPPVPGARGFAFNGMTVYIVPLAPHK